jgi:hypothetical protein
MKSTGKSYKAKGFFDFILSFYIISEYVTMEIQQNKERLKLNKTH